VRGRERLRLFVALLLPDEAVARLVEWQERELGGGPDLRIVPADNLHVTVAFLGGRPAADLERIAEPIRYRETRSVGMVVLSDENERATRLAERLFDGLERLRVYERERRDWLPHVTVVRFRERPRLAPPLPALGQVMSSELAVMMSRLRPSGAQYEVLESVPLGG
jgi:RNA 2',3'-cyclic 3'-phosphodiesterase